MRRLLRWAFNSAVAAGAAVTFLSGLSYWLGFSFGFSDDAREWRVASGGGQIAAYVNGPAPRPWPAFDWCQDGLHFCFDPRGWVREPLDGLRNRGEVSRRLGIGAGKARWRVVCSWSLRTLPFALPPGVPCHYAVAPFWLPGLAVGAALAVRFRHRLPGRRRGGTGLCAHCGYDLRATPGRCPECGHVPEKKGTRA